MTKIEKKTGSFTKVKVDIASKHPLQKKKLDMKTTLDKVEDSKQLKEEQKWAEWIIEPQIDFQLLRQTVQTSSVLSGIINKIASSCDTWFVETSDEKLNKILAQIDVYESVKNFSIFWNVFFEVLKNNWGEALDLDIILTETVKIVDKWDDEWVHITQIQGTKKEPFKKNEYIHIKRGSLTSKYYWDTIFIDCIESILLLYFIEQVYRKLFENGFIEPTLLVDEENVLTEDQKNAITTFVKDYFRGIDNGFELGIISGKIKKIDLTNKIDHNSFIALKKEIKEDISIALNIPFDLLSWKNSNRATRDSSFEDFNMTTVQPLQSRYVRQLKKWLRPFLGDVVDEIELNPIDTKNQLEESQVADKLIRCGVFSIDEWREFIGLDPTNIPENQNRKVYGGGSNSNQDKELDQVQEEVKKIYNKIWKL